MGTNGKGDPMEHYFLYIFWAIVGWGLSSSFWMHFWLPDPPPPDLLGRYVPVSIAGAVGGIAGGLIASRAVSDPMPGLAVVGAVAGALVLVGLVRVFRRSVG
jgi:hypothetical protein